VSDRLAPKRRSHIREPQDRHHAENEIITSSHNLLLLRHDLFDHLVGAGEQRGRNFETERPSGLGIDNQFELGCLHNRQVGWLSALEDSPGVPLFVMIVSEKLERNPSGKPL